MLKFMSLVSKSFHSLLHCCFWFWISLVLDWNKCGLQKSRWEVCLPGELHLKRLGMLVGKFESNLNGDQSGCGSSFISTPWQYHFNWNRCNRLSYQPLFRNRDHTRGLDLRDQQKSRLKMEIWAFLSLNIFLLQPIRTDTCTLTAKKSGVLSWTLHVRPESLIYTPTVQGV